MIIGSIFLASVNAVISAILFILGIVIIHIARKRLRESAAEESSSPAPGPAAATKKYVLPRCPHPIPDVAPEKIVCYDLETTGLDYEDKDEILSVTFIDGNGNALLNTLIKPETRKRWPNAQKINGISPSMVKDAPEFDDVRGEVQTILDNADLIIGYNILRFDNNFLEACGIRINERKCWDVMLEYSERYMGWNDYHGNRRWTSLSKAAGRFRYTYDEHDSLAEAQATLFVFNKLKQMDAKKGLDGYGS